MHLCICDYVYSIYNHGKKKAHSNSMFLFIGTQKLLCRPHQPPETNKKTSVDKKTKQKTDFNIRLLFAKSKPTFRNQVGK